MNSNHKNDLNWKRDREGKPVRTDKGSYVLVKNNSIYFGLYPDDVGQLQELIREMVNANIDFVTEGDNK